MIISRTPYRISFFGGATDYPLWYHENGGRVISVTINKYCYILARLLPQVFPYNNRIRYFKTEETKTIKEILHPSVRETCLHLNIEEGIEIVHSGDLPAQSGLGTSSAFTVGLLNSLWGLKGYMPTKRELAETAIHIEQNRIKEIVGSQDQTAAAFGGLNAISFAKTGRIEVDNIILSKKRISDLQNNLLLCFTGFSRTASEIEAEKIKNLSSKKYELTQMVQVCEEALNILVSEKESLDCFGKLLNEQWFLKKALSPIITNKHIDEIYECAIKNGALGGKILGAGSGGFFLIYAPVETHNTIKESLKEKLFVPLRFDFTGSKIIYFSHD